MLVCKALYALPSLPKRAHAGSIYQPICQNHSPTAIAYQPFSLRLSSFGLAFSYSVRKDTSLLWMWAILSPQYRNPSYHHFHIHSTPHVLAHTMSRLLCRLSGICRHSANVHVLGKTPSTTAFLGLSRPQNDAR